MTVPLAYETRNAFAIPFFAASVVRTLAWVAADIPMNPASADRDAPTMKQSAVNGLIASASMIARTTTKTPMAVYCRFRYTMAPSRMAAAIFCMSSLPVPSRFMTM